MKIYNYCNRVYINVEDVDVNRSSVYHAILWHDMTLFPLDEVADGILNSFIGNNNVKLWIDGSLSINDIKSICDAFEIGENQIKIEAASIADDLVIVLTLENANYSVVGRKGE
jgi:hypothetical protein